MGNLESRIAALEKKNPARVPPVMCFITFVSPGVQPETVGWRFSESGKQVHVMREPDESDEELQDRAGAAAVAAAVDNPDFVGIFVGLIQLKTNNVEMFSKHAHN